VGDSKVVRARPRNLCHTRLRLIYEEARQPMATARKSSSSHRSSSRKKSSSSDRKYSKKAQNKVGKVMHEYKHGKLKSGGKRKVNSRKQAIAIGLSEARRSGAKVPSRKKAA